LGVWGNTSIAVPESEEGPRKNKIIIKKNLTLFCKTKKYNSNSKRLKAVKS